jgi:hypothetical protein
MISPIKVHRVGNANTILLHGWITAATPPLLTLITEYRREVVAEQKSSRSTL